MATTQDRRRWYVPDAFIPTASTGSEISHESICVLNDTGADAQLQITVYFADREPKRSEPIAVPADRDLHLRTSRPDQVGGLVLEPGVPYGLVIESDADLQLQYSRLDTTQAAYTLMTMVPSQSHTR